MPPPPLMPCRAVLLCAALLAAACPARPPPADDNPTDGGVSPADGGTDAGSPPADGGAQDGAVPPDAGLPDAAIASDAAVTVADAGPGDAAPVPNVTPCNDCFVARSGFPVALPGTPASLGPLAVADTRGDAVREILVLVEDGTQTHGSLLVVSAAGAVLETVTETGGGAPSGPALWDLNADGKLDVAWGDRQATVHGHAFQGVAPPGLPRTAGSAGTVQGLMAWRDPVLADGVLSFTVNANLFRLRAAGGNADGWPNEISAAQLPDGATACELTGDVRPEAVAVTVSGGTARVSAFDAVGALVPGFPAATAVDVTAFAPSCVDVDGDGRDEVFYADSFGRLHAFNHDGSLRAGFPFAAGPGVATPVVAGDLTGDGRPELVLVSRRGGAWGLQAFGADASVVAGFPVTLPAAPAGSPLLADTNGDGRCDVLLVTLDGSALLVDSRGALRPVLGRSLGITPVGTPALDDVDGDGKWDLVVAGTAALGAWTVQGAANLGHAPWVRYRGHDGRTGRYRGEAWSP